MSSYAEGGGVLRIDLLILQVLVHHKELNVSRFQQYIDREGADLQVTLSYLVARGVLAVNEEGVYRLADRQKTINWMRIHHPRRLPSNLRR